MNNLSSHYSKVICFLMSSKTWIPIQVSHVILFMAVIVTLPMTLQKEEENSVRIEFYCPSSTHNSSTVL